MKYTKSFISFKEQIELLEQRGIQFKKISKEKAEERISHINYFKLSGYIKKFAITNDNYSSVDFQEILDLYYFDKELRNVLFHSIEKIEISFKTKLAYYIAKEINEKGATSYVVLENWTNKNKVINKRNNSPWTKEEKIAFQEKSYEFQNKIKQYTQRGKNDFINNYFKKYEGEFLPIWMIVEVIDFGMAVQIYSLAKQSLRKEIANTYKLTSKDLDFYLRSLNRERS